MAVAYVIQPTASARLLGSSASSAPLETAETIAGKSAHAKRGEAGRAAALSESPSRGVTPRGPEGSEARLGFPRGNRGNGETNDSAESDAETGEHARPAWEDPWTREHWWANDMGSLRVASDLGLDVAELLTETRPADATDDRNRTMVGRRTVVRAFGHEILTRTGEPRSARIKDCGHLRPAIRGTEMGIANWRCHDRLCPSCAERRAREMASALFFFAQHRAESGRLVLFVTLTQLKRPVHVETPEKAITRWLDAWREMTDSRYYKRKTTVGMRFNMMTAGAIRGVELTWSPKGKRNADGSVVKYSGWHAHGHCLVEIMPGIDFRQAARELMGMWRAVSGGAKASAQNVQQVAPAVPGTEDRCKSRIYEVCKYPLKLPGFDNAAVLCSAATALASRRVIDGVKEWRGALAVGRKLRALEEPPRAPVRMADQRVYALRDPDNMLSFSEFKGGHASHFYVEASKFRQSLLRDPRTFDQRDRDREAGVEAPARRVRPPPRGPPDPVSQVAMWT